MKRLYVAVCIWNQSEIKLPDYLREFNSPYSFSVVMAILERIPKSPFKSIGTINEGKNVCFTRDINLYEIKLFKDEEYYIETKLDDFSGFMVESIHIRKKDKPKINSKVYLEKAYKSDDPRFREILPESHSYDMINQHDIELHHLIEEEHGLKKNMKTYKEDKNGI